MLALASLADARSLLRFAARDADRPPGDSGVHLGWGRWAPLVALLHAVPDGIEPRRVQLLATYEAALERVPGDPVRSLSKDPGLLRLTYDRVQSFLPTMPPPEWEFDTTTVSWREIVDDLAAALRPESR